MIDERLRELIRLRMQQARETLHEARILIGERASRGAVNRAYYAMLERTIWLFSYTTV